MAVEIKMPRLSQTTEEVRLIRWLVDEGDTLRKGQALCEVENDKTTMEVESFAAGTVLHLYGQPDSVIEAGTVIALLGEPGERAAVAEGGLREDTTASEQMSGATGDVPSPAATAPPPEASARSAVAALGPLPSGVLATHLVQNIAGKRGIDLTQVRGSGAGGLITKMDLETFVAGTVAAGLSEHQVVLGRNLQAAKSQIPHYYLRTTIFCERLLSLRDMNRRADGQKVSLNAILLHRVARVLRRHPRLNASFRDGQLQVSSEINIGLAVAVEDELYVPLIRRADSKEIGKIDQELQGLVAKAQAGRLEPEDIRGGTFTLTNLGMYAVEEFTAIINPPQVAILAFGRIGKALELDDSGAVCVRSVCTMKGSFDHRVVNGAQGAAFLSDVKTTIEEEL
jgi:pyruvate dehydrogenase E2 component (dihydrolipoamide acetyltransferase)